MKRGLEIPCLVCVHQARCMSGNGPTMTTESHQVEECGLEYRVVSCGRFFPGDGDLHGIQLDIQFAEVARRFLCDGQVKS